jgi:hypothetical protein
MSSRTSMAAFTVLLATCAAGVFQASWWVVVVCASLLALHTLARLSALTSGTGNTRTVVSASTYLASTCLNAGGAAASAFVLGRAIGWFWGL